VIETVAKAAIWGAGSGVVMFCAGIAWERAGGGWLRSTLERRSLTATERKRKWVAATSGGLAAFLLALLTYSSL